MASRFIKAVDNKLLAINPDQKWMKSNLHYEVIGGSQSYGVTQDSSDIDIIGWCIPPKDMIFPHLAGYIHGFGPGPQSFESFQQHHVKDNKVEYDFTIYSVVKFVDLVMQNNPNMIDYLFVPFNCITHMTSIGQILRDNRKGFLHKGAYHKFRGYCFSQLNKLKTKEANPNMSSKRRDLIAEKGFDTKFASHAVRLLDECRQILETGDLDIQQDRERIKAIRRGDWTKEQVFEFVQDQQPLLEELYAKSTLTHSPDINWCRNILLQIIEEHYGTITEGVRTDSGALFMNELKQLIVKYS